MLCLYFLSLFAVFCAIKDIRSAVICLVAGYLVSFYTTYLNHTKLHLLSQALMALWILIFIWEYGWDCGVQHFVFVLLVQFYRRARERWECDRRCGTGTVRTVFSPVCLYEQVMIR